jgi:DNA-directed RNA polymerase delta subunit
LIRGGLDKQENATTVMNNVYTALKRGKDTEFVKIAKEWGLKEFYPTPRPSEKRNGRHRKIAKRTTETGQTEREKPSESAGQKEKVQKVLEKGS